MATQRSKKGSEKVLGKASQKGSEKGVWEGVFQKVPGTLPWRVRPPRHAPYESPQNLPFWKPSVSNTILGAKEPPKRVPKLLVHQSCEFWQSPELAILKPIGFMGCTLSFLSLSFSFGKSVTFLAGHGESCPPHGWSTWRPADQPTTRWSTWTWCLFKGSHTRNPCGSACCGLRVAMWITRVGGKFRHGLLEKSLEKRQENHPQNKGFLSLPNP